ncbi:hypothetical protein Aca07nite_07070 [Actinoplanes capillaceus]|uniref:PKD domain-containing protein n=1 Tax=Actinoplanes campanulatus TaxID=113559 RepID=A0ABQ3W8V6_9ACTN|nr:PKD domain-containing protein [Actinoplanes capillaceus]GID43432.1 hypothetical protein Aca07nite_07070 [Actinoplanes capillaceus]
MKTRLAVAVVSGALIAGGTLIGAPAYAIPDSAADAPSGKYPSAVTEEFATGLDAADPTPSPTDPTATPTDPTPTPTDPTPTPTSTDPTPDTTKPTGTFVLDYTSVWTGQKIKFIQESWDYSDPGDAQDNLKRVVSWGDGTSTVLNSSTYTATKSYTRSGSFKVTVTITDPAGNTSAIPARTVAVTVPAGKVALDRKSVYQGTFFNLNVSKIPAGATGFLIDWSDGWVSSHRATTGSRTGQILYQWKWDAAKKKYVLASGTRISGVRTLKIAWGNGKGYGAWQTIGSINVLKDKWKPTVTIKKPSSTNRASSWKTITGTVGDKGSGVRHLGVTAVRITASGKGYCLTPARKWKRYYSESQLIKYCYATGVKVKIKNGKWSLKLPAGLGKNQAIGVDAWVYDYADYFRQTYRTARITRS